MTFDWKALLASDSGFIAPAASHAKRQWHSNSGWFEFESHNVRLLRKANIEVVERATLEGPKPAITIATEMRREVFGPVGTSVTNGLPVADTMRIIENLHNGLISIFRSMVVPEMAARVGIKAS